MVEKPTRDRQTGLRWAAMLRAGLRLHLKRTHVAHRSERESRLCKVPLNSAWSTIVRFLQTEPLSLADAQQDARGNHPDGAARRQSRAGVRKPVATLSFGAPSPRAATTKSERHEHPTNKESSSGAADPNLRSPHTNIHLFERVSVDGP
jgi:hypothetical protein